jgi:hypothetical protein
VIFAACVIALAALLLFYLFKPRKNHARGIAGK